jgi:hypothetical protein
MKSILMALALVFSTSAFAVQNGTYRCQLIENEDEMDIEEGVELKPLLFKIEVQDHYFAIYDEDGTLDGVLKIDAGGNWTQDGKESRYLVTRISGQLISTYQNDMIDEADQNQTFAEDTQIILTGNINLLLEIKDIAYDSLKRDVVSDVLTSTGVCNIIN